MNACLIQALYSYHVSASAQNFSIVNVGRESMAIVFYEKSRVNIGVRGESQFT